MSGIIEIGELAGAFLCGTVSIIFIVFGCVVKKIFTRLDKQDELYNNGFHEKIEWMHRLEDKQQVAITNVTDAIRRLSSKLECVADDFSDAKHEHCLFKTKDDCLEDRRRSYLRLEKVERLADSNLDRIEKIERYINVDRG